MMCRLITKLPEIESYCDLWRKCRNYLNKIKIIDKRHTSKIQIERMTISKETGSVTMYLRSMDSEGKYTIPFCRYTATRKALEPL
jgi:hypothetical protein